MSRKTHPSTITPALPSLSVLCLLWAGCTATPIEIPGADGGASMPDMGSPPPGADSAATAFDAGVPQPPDAPRDAMDFNAVAEQAFAPEATVDVVGAVTAIHADGVGLYVAVDSELRAWPVASAASELHSQQLPSTVRQIATGAGADSRIYLATDQGVSSVPRAGSGLPAPPADLQVHYASPGGETFFGGVAVGATVLYVSDSGGHQVVRIPRVGGGGPQVIYTSPYQQASTLSTALATLGDQVFFADSDGPMQADGLSVATPLGAPRANYRWAGLAATKDALYVAQAGDFTEGLTSIALPSGAEQVLLWIGGANNNAGIDGPVLLGDRLAWSAGDGVFLTEIQTGATTRIVNEACRLAGHGDTLYWAPIAGKTLNRAALPPTP